MIDRPSRCNCDLVHVSKYQPTNPQPARKFPNERWILTATGQLRSALSSKLCATVNKLQTVTLAHCVLPVPKSQQWSYNSKSQQLTTGDGLCVTAAKPSPSPSPAVKATTMVLGKPLVGRAPGHATGTDLAAPRSFAILFLNNQPNSTALACNQTCLARLGMPPPGVGATRYVVQDVWSRSKIMTVASGETIAIAQVPGKGGSVYVRVDPL